MTGGRASALTAFGDAMTILLASALGMVVEIVAGRLLAPHVGMSLYTWTAIIAVVLGGFSLGHWWGGLMAGPGCDRRAGHRTVHGRAPGPDDGRLAGDPSGAGRADRKSVV